ncbi:MAG: transketolase, partial [Gemmatimonadales bacterium]|nr:transketolase [Gemmatimonadales bacterium]
FDAQPASYRHAVLPPKVDVRVAIEAAHPMPWHRWLGTRGEIIGLSHFGASAPYERLYEEFGLTASAIVERVHRLLAA